MIICYLRELVMFNKTVASHVFIYHRHRHYLFMLLFISNLKINLAISQRAQKPATICGKLILHSPSSIL